MYLYFTVRPTVHTNPSRKWGFSKTLSKPEEFENAGFAFGCLIFLVISVIYLCYFKIDAENPYVCM